MKKTIRNSAMMSLLVVLAACAESSDSLHASAALVYQQMTAFNQRDVEALTANVTEDFEFLFVSGDQVAVETRGQEAFRSAMQDYFAQLPTVSSEIESLIISGGYVSFSEHVSWVAGGQQRSQRSLAVYEISDDKIRRAWYYPAN